VRTLGPIVLDANLRQTNIGVRGKGFAIVPYRRALNPLLGSSGGAYYQFGTPFVKTRTGAAALESQTPGLALPGNYPLNVEGKSAQGGSEGAWDILGPDVVVLPQGVGLLDISGDPHFQIAGQAYLVYCFDTAAEMVRFDANNFRNVGLYAHTYPASINDPSGNNPTQLSQNTSFVPAVTYYPDVAGVAIDNCKSLRFTVEASAQITDWLTGGNLYLWLYDPVAGMWKYNSGFGPVAVQDETGTQCLGAQAFAEVQLGVGFGRAFIEPRSVTTHLGAGSNRALTVRMFAS
jgi:hypothetical protein